MLAATTLLPVAMASAAGGAAGVGLDPTFGHGGLAVVSAVRTQDPGEGDTIGGIGMALQPNGRIVAAGGLFDSDNPHVRSRFVVARVFEGGLDPSFGDDGRVVTDFGSRSANAHAVVVLPDGRIVAAGGGQGFALARYRPDGTLDPTFGGDGTVVTGFDGGEALDLLRQPDGKLVAVGLKVRQRITTANGIETRTDIALARYDIDGRLDGSFGNGGEVVGDFGLYDVPGKAALDAAGRILVPVGSAVARYNADGSLDRTFGRHGEADTTITGTSSAVAVAGRRIVVAGTKSSGGTVRFFVVRFTSSGTLDRTFSSDGIVVPKVPRLGWAADLAIQRNGKIAVLGTALDSKGPGLGPIDAVVTRLLSNGSIDRSFGAAGTARIDFGTWDFGQALAIQRDGKLVAAGATGVVHNYVLTLARLLPDHRRRFAETATRD